MSLLPVSSSNEDIGGVDDDDDDELIMMKVVNVEISHKIPVSLWKINMARGKNKKLTERKGAKEGLNNIEWRFQHTEPRSSPPIK